MGNKMVTTRKGILGLAWVVFSSLFAMGVSQATTISFTNVTNNSDLDLSGQLTMEVTQVGDQAYFTFMNDVDSGFGSSIADIYFDYDLDAVTLISIDSMSSGVDFSDGATPSNLPGGGDFEADYAADSNEPVASNGVDESGEYITFLATLSEGFDLLQAIYDGTFNVGLHVQSIDDRFDNSDSYVSTVPVPAAGLLFATALLGAGFAGRRKQKAKSNDIVGAFARAS